MNRLKDKAAIVTGAAQGVGLTTVKKFLEEGAKVIGTDINEEKLKNSLEALHNDDLIWCKHDVSKEEDWQNVVQTALNKFGKLDVLVNNAGFIIGKDVLEES